VTGTCLLAVFLTGLAGAWALRTTPVLGIKVVVSGDRLMVDSVQEQGPAAGLIMPGETVCSIGGVKLRATDRMRFPVYPGARAEREWWARQERIYAELIRTPCVSVTVASARRGERTVWLTTRKATWGAIVWANLPFYLSGIGLAILAWMIPLRGRNAGNLITKCVCAMMAIYHMAIAPSLVQEITVNPFIRNGLAHLAYVSISSTLFLALWPLVFPAKKPVFRHRPWLVRLPCAYYGLSVALYLSRVIGFGSAALGLAIWPLVFIPAALHSCLTEDDLLHRRQLRLFLAIPVLLAGFIMFRLVLPGGLWQQPLDYPFLAMMTLVFGFSLMLAVENQRVYQQTLEKEHQYLQDRLKMVREMHDNFSNTVAGIFRLADQAEEAAGDAVPVRQIVGQIRRSAEACWKEARNFISAVDPATIDWDDYCHQCRELALGILAPAKIQLVFRSSLEHPGEVRPPVQYHLTGILREALANVAKHSGARMVNVCLNIQAGEGMLSIEDDGKGFNPSRIPPGTYGVGNMGDRAKELGGDVSIHAKGRGTRVRVAFRA
jgi:signal transduction histidine kinase